MKIVYLMLTILLFTCNSDNDSSDIEHHEKIENFQRFNELIKCKELPLRLNCTSISSNKEQDFSPYNIFIPKGYQVFEKICSEDNFLLICFSSIQDVKPPRLFSFSSKGGIIDSLQISSCFGSAVLESSGETYIDWDGHIEIIDTSKYFTYMKHGTEYIRGLDSIVTSSRIISITETGKFKLINKTSTKQ